VPDVDAGPTPAPECEGPLVAPFGFENAHKCAHAPHAFHDLYARFWRDAEDNAGELRACTSDRECVRANVNVSCTDGLETSSTEVACGIAVNANTACDYFAVAQREWEQACANACMPHGYFSTPQCIPSEPRCVDGRCDLAWGGGL
jgi:hypothetical protein